MSRPRGMRFKKVPPETDLFCPNCLLMLEKRSDLNKSVGDCTKASLVNTFFCVGCVKTYVRSRVLSFNEMVSEKFNRQKTRARCAKHSQETKPARLLSAGYKTDLMSADETGPFS